MTGMQRILVFGTAALVAAIAAAVPFFRGGVQAPNGIASSSSTSPIVVSSAPSAPAGQNATELPFTVPTGYRIEVFADALPGARVIVRDGFGNYWVSQPSAGTVSQIEMDGDTVKGVHAVLRGLDGPHGLAIDPESNGMTLYVAEEREIKRVYLYSDGPIEHVADLPATGQHRTRTLGFGPDGRLYVSAGSTCNVCNERDERIAAIFSMNKDGSDQTLVATGLRNAVFFTWHENGRMYATEMGRDLLGDHLPPEEVNIIEKGKHYGWPYCYGDRIRDNGFQGGEDFNCDDTVAPLVQLPAHIAPLGLAFLPDGDLLVAEHGSWNSSVKVGYKIVRIPMDSDGQPNGEPVDFLTGFLDGNTVHGRPVGLLVEDDGDILITDDRKGVVYRMKKL